MTNRRRLIVQGALAMLAAAAIVLLRFLLPATDDNPHRFSQTTDGRLPNLPAGSTTRTLRDVQCMLFHILGSSIGDTAQIVLVLSDAWDSTEGALYRLTLEGYRLASNGESFPVRLGGSGLGWGIGVHTERYPRRPGDPFKTEGDQRTPAGLFHLGPVFGKDPNPPPASTLPYRTTTARDYYVDDSTSADYNRWRRIPPGAPNRPDRLWKSYERMRRADGLYDLGIVVGHNPAAVPGHGSAIFLHLGDEPTLGCIALSAEALKATLRWLRARPPPVLLVLPRAALNC